MHHSYNMPEHNHLSSNFKKRMAAYNKQHNGVPNGRNFATWDHPGYTEDQRKYRGNFDSIFPDAPGAGL